MKTLLYFGLYDRNYARTKVLQHGFQRNGWEVNECHVDPRKYRGIGKYVRLFWLGLKARQRKYDLVVVGFPGQHVVWLARLLFGPDIIFDAFLSLYDSNVFDRKLYRASSWKGRKDKWLDTWSCRLAGKILLDTNQHIEYFVQTFGIPRDKFERIWISADDTVFFPRQDPAENRFIVHFHGMFIPLQGVSYIVKAANILRDEDIYFRIVGGGQEYEMIRKLAENLTLDKIEFSGKVPLEKIPGYMASAQIVLGIFGETEKTGRVIPNKVYEALAMGKAVITADTQAIRELEGSQHALELISVADEEALASAIKMLRAHEDKRISLGHAARELFEKELLPEKIVAELLKRLV